MDKFQKEVISLANNPELQQSAAGLARDFVVLLRITKYDGEK